MMEKAGLYIHIPFCVQKCMYCDFLSFSGRFHFAKQYADQVCAEIVAKKEWGTKLEFDTIFIGGGTPSSIPAEYIAQILAKAKNTFPFTESAEISIEVNPGTVTQDTLIAYKDMGINRISMGIQSTSDRLLRAMGRIHTKKEALDSGVTIARYFNNVNFDFISGVPAIQNESAQTQAELEDDLLFIRAMQVPHVSIYSMIIEPGTPLYALTQEGKAQSCDEDLERTMYHTIRKRLTDAGYVHYEISNFARPGYMCKHNMKYWQGKPYLGVGLGSASFLPWKNESYVRSTNVQDFSTYFMQENFEPEERITISLDERRKEYMMLGFRLTAGPDEALYARQFGTSMTKDFKIELEQLQQRGLIQENYGLTVKGMDYANDIFREFV